MNFHRELSTVCSRGSERGGLRKLLRNVAEPGPEKAQTWERLAADERDEKDVQAVDFRAGQSFSEEQSR